MISLYKNRRPDEEEATKAKKIAEKEERMKIKKGICLLRISESVFSLKEILV